MKKLFLYILVLASFGVDAQTRITIGQRIGQMKQDGVVFKNFDIFRPTTQQNDLKLGSYTAFKLDKSQLTELYNTAPEQISFALPYKSQIWNLQFTRAHALDSTKFTITGTGTAYTDTTYKRAILYHGIITNTDSASLVTATVFNNSIRIFASTEGRNIQAGATDDKTVDTDDYASFGELPGNNEPFAFSCGTKESQDNSGLNQNGLNGAPPEEQGYTGKIVRCFFDCSYAFYQHYSSTAACYNKITDLFNQAALFYANENINLAISEIRIWTSTDPYLHFSREFALSTFKSYVENDYQGDLAMLCDWQSGNSGLADGIGVLCQEYESDAEGPYIYNDFNFSASFSNFPVEADAPLAYLIAHEIGHVLGSHHTHWCGWVGGPIDNCFLTEGDCSSGPTPAHGTMMSYCCLNSSIRVDFNYGFGTQPGNAIRSHISTRACLSNGTGICDSSMYLQGSISNSDFTRFEAKDMITSENVLSASSNVLFDAGKVVDLKPPFSAPTGSLLRVVLEGCGGLYSLPNSVPKK